LKKLLSLLAAVCVALTLGITTSAAVNTVFIADNAGFFTDSEFDRLYDKATEISEERGWCIMIITEEGDYSESKARRELRDWYGDEFGSSEKGAAFIMTSETYGDYGNNDYALVIETFGNASISNKTNAYNRAEDYFLDYDEYGSADAFLSACDKTTGSSNSGSEGGGASRVLVGIIVVVLLVGSVAVSYVKRKALNKMGINTGYNNRRYRNNNYNNSSDRNSKDGRSGKR
jgi:hypothetical protein